MSVARVYVSNNGGHSDETWAEMMTNKIIQVSEEAPEPIKAQAKAFRDRVYLMLLSYVKNIRKETIEITEKNIIGELR